MLPNIEPGNTLSGIFTENVVCLHPTAPLNEAIALMERRKISAIVVSEDDKPIGIVTERDIVRLAYEKKLPKDFRIGDWMSTPVTTASKEMDRREAYQLMLTNGIRHLVLVNDDDTLAGIISEHDIRSHLRFEHFLGLKKVTDIMTANVITLGPHDKVQSAIGLMRNNRISCIVIKYDNRPKGILTERDIVALIRSGKDFDKLPLEEVMNAPVVTLLADNTVQDASVLMDKSKIRRIVIVDEQGHLVGLICQQDTLKVLQEQFIDYLKEVVSQQTEWLENTKRELSEKEALLDAILRSVTDSAVIASDSESRILYHNPVTEKMLGCRGDELTSATLDRIFRWGNIDSNDQKKFLDDVHEKEWTEFVIEKTGQPEMIYIQGRITAMFDPTHQLRGYVVVLRDISEIRQKETAIKESELKLRQVIDLVPHMIFARDYDGGYLLANKAVAVAHGVTTESIIGKKNDDLEGGQTDYVQFLADEREVIRTGSPKLNPEERFTTANGSARILETTMIPFNMGSNQQKAVLGVSVDMTERKIAEDQLTKLSLAVKHSPSSVTIMDVDGVIEYVNPKFTEITGYKADEIVGHTRQTLKSSATSEEVYKDLWNTLRSGKEWRGEMRNKKKDGTYYWGQESISPIKDKTGEITHFVLIEEDITEARQISEQLAYHAKHDLLTGLLNRREFEHRLEAAVITAQGENAKHVLCYLDLDQFKVINDTCGHIAGDELLRQLSRVLQENIRQSDTLARLGGDEFGILIENCSTDQGCRTANTLREAVEHFQFAWQHKRFNLGVSIGVVSISDGSQMTTELMKRADAACYAAKDAGRNRIHVYHDNDQDFTRRSGEKHWESEINAALSEDRLILYFQPIISLANPKGENTHYELLVRLKTEDGHIAIPGAFLPASERYNLSGRIDRWVIVRALEYLANLPADKQPMLTINLSELTLSDTGFLEFLGQQFTRSGVAHNRICFEITETTAISNLSNASIFIQSLKDQGCFFSLDDYGGGLSSFAYLKNLNVDYLKINGSFVKDILHDPIDLAMVKSINEIGHVMHKQTIAEHVENRNVLDALSRIGVDYAQGHLIGKPELLC